MANGHEEGKVGVAHIGVCGEDASLAETGAGAAAFVGVCRGLRWSEEKETKLGALLFFFLRYVRRFTVARGYGSGAFRRWVEETLPIRMHVVARADTGTSLLVRTRMHKGSGMRRACSGVGRAEWCVGEGGGDARSGAVVECEHVAQCRAGKGH